MPGSEVGVEGVDGGWGEVFGGAAAAFAGDPQDAAGALPGVVVDVGGEGFGDSQSVVGQQRDQGVEAGGVGFGGVKEAEKFVGGEPDGGGVVSPKHSVRAVAMQGEVPDTPGERRQILAIAADTDQAATERRAEEKDRSDLNQLRRTEQQYLDNAERTETDLAVLLAEESHRRRQPTPIAHQEHSLREQQRELGNLAATQPVLRHEITYEQAGLQIEPDR